MSGVLSSALGLSIPLVAAPMAGGPTTPGLVVAAARAGGLGFLAGGYRTAEQLGAQIDEVREHSTTFGVNLFAPNPVPVEPAAYARYRDLLQVEAERLGVTLPEQPKEDDDHWKDKVDLLLDRQVPVVSFTFGIPGPRVLEAFRDGGTLLVQTVTSAAEARRAADAGVDLVAVQGSRAGGHSGTLTPEVVPPEKALEQLLREVRHAVVLPAIAAGGLMEAEDVAAIIREGADAAVVGTALLLTPESGSTLAHRTALTDPARGDTVVTRAFTGRPARAVPNAFLEKYDASAPPGYPALHHLTSPIRKAAAALVDPELVNVWAGTGYRRATPDPAADVLRRLAALL